MGCSTNSHTGTPGCEVEWGGGCGTTQKWRIPLKQEPSAPGAITLREKRIALPIIYLICHALWIARNHLEEEIRPESNNIIGDGLVKQRRGMRFSKDNSPDVNVKHVITGIQII